MTNEEIASKMVKVRRAVVLSGGHVGKRRWAVYAPGLPGMRQLQGTFEVKANANAHAFLIAAQVAGILDAADRLKKEAKRK